jgi:hypothetical protein
MLPDPVHRDACAFFRVSYQPHDLFALSFGSTMAQQDLAQDCGGIGSLVEILIPVEFEGNVVEMYGELNQTAGVCNAQDIGMKYWSPQNQTAEQQDQIGWTESFKEQLINPLNHGSHRALIDALQKNQPDRSVKEWANMLVLTQTVDGTVLDDGKKFLDYGYRSRGYTERTLVVTVNEV